MRIKKALLIDDTDIDQKLYRRILERSKIVDDVTSFTYAEDALEYLRTNPSEEIDVIFLDINMPKMNGFEFLEASVAELGEKFAHVVIVMLTTSLNPGDRERAEQFSIVRDFINKPLTLDHIKHVAELVCAERKKG